MHLLAHQGGWDELLWFAAPIVAVMLWVRWAERKARSRSLFRPEGDVADADAGDGTPSTLPPHHRDH